MTDNIPKAPTAPARKKRSVMSDLTAEAQRATEAKPAEAAKVPAKTKGNWREGSVEINPFPGDDALYVVTGDNLDLYRDKLSDGHIRMLEQYGPAFFMPVYETRRTAAFPEHVYEKFRQNALTAELLDNGNGVRDTIMTSPFPIPQNGLEAIWNHILRYRGEEVSFRSASATPQVDGSFNPKGIRLILRHNWRSFRRYINPQCTCGNRQITYKHNQQPMARHKGLQQPCFYCSRWRQ